MRTHIAKSAHLPAEYIPHTFLTRTPPPRFPQVDGGGCYREKFFLFFQNTFRLAIIFISVLYLFDFHVEFNFLVYIAIYGFDYNFGFCIFRFYITTRILIFIFFIFSIRFYSHQFRLVSALLILCFDSLSLWLFCLL